MHIDATLKRLATRVRIELTYKGFADPDRAPIRSAESTASVGKNSVLSAFCQIACALGLMLDYGTGDQKLIGLVMSKVRMSLGVRWPAGTRKTLGRIPRVKAGGTDACRFERVPDLATITKPAAWGPAIQMRLWIWKNWWHDWK